jgi:hypothetical protein
MPYYVYRIESKPFKKLDKLNAFESFREASGYAKEARAGISQEIQIKVIFAENELQAEDLLNTVRQAQVTGSDD